MYSVPTLEEMLSFLVALTKALLPTRSVARYSKGWKFLRTVSAAATDNHAHIKSVESDLMPDTAEGDMAERWGALLGVTRNPATPARKANALRVVGVEASDVPFGAELTHTSGLRYQVNEDAVIPVAGYVDVDVVAIDTGSATRLNAGETLTFVSPPVGLEETAALVLDLDEDGTDVESLGAYRNRYLGRLSNPPLGGAEADFQAWAKQVTGIASAYVYPVRAGAGSVDVAALHEGTGTARILTEGERADLETYIHTKRPTGYAAFRVLSVFPETVDMEVPIVTTGEDQYEFDWNDATPLIVSTWNGGTRTLTFTTNRPDTMKAGDRVVLRPVSGLGTGEQYVIESLSGAAAVVLETAPDPAPVATDVVYSGGAAVDAVRDALLAHVNHLGTSNPDGHRYGAWEGNLRPLAVGRIATSVPGVLDVDLDTLEPDATVEASDPRYPDDATIGLLVPGRVIVRRAHV